MSELPSSFGITREHDKTSEYRSKKKDYVSKYLYKLKFGISFSAATT